MPTTVDTEEQAEALVDTLQIDATHLTDANLSGLSSSDLEQLADLEAELCMDSTDIVEGIEVKQMLDNDIVETEIGVQEEEIETEEIDASELPHHEETEEILPDMKDTSIKMETSSSAPPPLRPLTIAPKPTKVPLTLKTALVNTSSGQQIVFIQSPGGSANAVNIGGQPIKLVSAQGQPVTIPSFQNVALTNTKQGVVQLRQGNKTEQPKEGAVKKVVSQQNKNIVAKVILGGQQQQVVLTSQASEAVQPQQIKLVASSLSSPSGSTATKTITLAQAQQMGLITTTNKMQQIVPQSPTKSGVVNKQVQGKTIKVVPQVKSPTKILPAPAQGQKVQTPKGTQRVIIRQGNQIKGGTVVGSGMNQVIRIPASQALASGQIHQINVPGKGVQYIRFMATTSATTNTTTTTSSLTTAKTVTTTTSPSQKAQTFPVTSMVVNRQGTANNSIKSPTSTGNVIKVVPISTTQARPVAPKPVMSAQRIIIPATNTQKSAGQTLTTIPASALSQIQGALLPSGNNLGQIVMLPAQVVQQLQNQSQQSASVTMPTPKVAVTPKSVPQKVNAKVSPTQAKENVTSIANEIAAITNPESSFTRPVEPNGIRPRKPCNCQKSLCLKLYCDCFANGEFCHMCNCLNCFNNLEKEEERQRAIRNCLERNPNAFRPKIGKGRDSSETAIRKHTKGCNCKRSGCLKNYCECYEAKIACSSNCKCIGCQNIEDSMEKKNVRAMMNTSAEQSLQVVPTAKVKLNTSTKDVTTFRQILSNSNTKLPSNYITQDVIEATNLCMIAQADEVEKNMESDEFGKKQILEEFGRCLVEIIECSSQANQLNT